MSKVRTRFAPSPTGYLHVGGIRTALFAWLLARQNDGQFILRLEDTDQKREVEGAAEHIEKSLKALGLDFDEGPVRQSDRVKDGVYKKWAQKLIDSGRAYADPYSAEEVKKFREQAQKEKKPFLYRNHRPQFDEDNPPQWDGTQPLRFKSEPKNYKWTDAVMGELSTGPEVIDDFILIKSDGFPTYNFAHIVDDAEMEISHVIRGQEFLASVPNYLNLYEALGFDMASFQAGHERKARALGEGDETTNSVRSELGGRALPPIMATMPHILNEHGNKKLSKRDGAKDVLDYIRDGYLPEALVSFIATLGWNDGTTQEVFTSDELIEKFSLERVGKGGAHFDEKRLNWINGHFIRETEIDELYKLSKYFWPEAAKDSDEKYKKQVLALVQERLKYLGELPELTEFFFKDLPVNSELISSNKQLKKLEKPELKELLEKAKETIEQSNFETEDLQERLNKLLESTGQKPGVLFSLIRIATTQAPASPGLAETLNVLGRETTLRRLDQTIQTL